MGASLCGPRISGDKGANVSLAEGVVPCAMSTVMSSEDSCLLAGPTPHWCSYDMQWHINRCTRVMVV